MNPGPVEEAGKTAQSAIEALKGQPAMLALVIFLALYIGFESYLSLQERQHWKDLVVEAMKWCPANAGYERPKQ